MYPVTNLYLLQVPSMDFLGEAFWDGKGPSPSIRFTYQKDGKQCCSGIQFSRVAASRMHSERCCTAWQVEVSYDALVEVQNSSWLEEIVADTEEHWRNKWQMHHYMIYLDSAGCFEVIAESWRVIDAGS